ncbi:NAD(P)-dependent oxidoreductase [Ammoniphilus sp. YIM 78166]|uniref:NAD(P)-dependent oxidoreductase n=1 Tax=Ammoniphilus sp. YIM 78166 TaxID=1644106 RepID=UPI00106FF76F|nr:NAD(P)-dependent oxidoreductase [Ammoniphilus sp. YIM 78166]
MQDRKTTFIPVESLLTHFTEVVPPLRKKDAMDESNRCLYCYDAPCITACPTGINIPQFIKRIAQENMKGAATTIMDANPVGASCARVCPTEQLCEGACVLNDASKPIMIGMLQRYATDWAIENNEVLFKPGEYNGKKVAIIGSGPAGLSTARELARKGYKVTIFEAKELAGGLNTYGIVSFRLPQSIALWEVDQVRRLGVEIRTSTCIGKDIQPQELMGEYDAVVLAIGMGNVPDLGIEGEELTGVYDAIELIQDTKSKELDDRFIGSRVAVIGAGNTAIDAATCSKRLGAENVKILYRRTENEMSAYPFEYEFAKQDGIEFRWLVTPKRIIGEGRVQKLECIRMELGEPDASGRQTPVPIPGSEFTLEVDAVVKAIGQTRHLELIEAFGLSHSHGVISVQQDTFQTSQAKVYAAGDCIFGKGQGEAMVVEAAQQGKLVAQAVDRDLMTDAHSEEIAS